MVAKLSQLTDEHFSQVSIQDQILAKAGGCSSILIEVLDMTRAVSEPQYPFCNIGIAIRAIKALERDGQFSDRVIATALIHVQSGIEEAEGKDRILAGLARIEVLASVFNDGKATFTRFSVFRSLVHSALQWLKS